MRILFYKITWLLIFTLIYCNTNACSILYYVDPATGKIYVANNEDYWYDIKPYIEILPSSKNEYARLWYGWDNFAQGGVNEYGLFFDGAATPEEPAIDGYSKPKGNLGDRIISKCKTVTEAIDLLEQEKIALTNGHLFLGDKTGNAAVVEWANGKRNLVFIKDNVLLATNFLLTDTTKGNYPCQRYNAMEKDISYIKENNETVNLKRIGNVAAKAVQLPSENKENQTAGTLYSTFIDITDMEFVLIYKLDNSKVTHFDLKEEFNNNKKQKIKLY
ncbi:carcinine hydrolase/isopenicillin-N N-acyltransferase family protein [Sporocytophaga myxococcoides]|uniref:carcinine hydrolase/isopenicillin-N N-acyltransferase family protein n=1 Tax=Sporocytophaga myxococcoides TaxID=153721 RepID=UPI00056028D4|nr:carcinine hydrolase/isopenicillin-N N-acyltransferase family protein [Sporocytophaga myxococcoides]